MIEENKETIVIVNPLSKKWSTVLLQITMKLREAIRSQNSRWCTLGLKVRSLQKKIKQEVLRVARKTTNIHISHLEQHDQYMYRP